MNHSNSTDQLGLATRCVRSGEHRSQENEHSNAIYMTSSFMYDSAQECADRFAGRTPGNVYSRFSNPTVDAFGARLAQLEGGQSCVATGSGMAAILATCLTLLEAGDHVVASRALFGSTTRLFDNYLARFGIEFSYVDPADLAQWQNAIKPNTRLLFAETPSNPLTTLVDIAAVAKLANEAGAWLVIDNCFCTPILQRPLELGAHIVIHSATKYLDGQGRAIGGAVIGDAETVGDRIHRFLRTAGPSMSPFNAWIFHKALETLELRMQAHCRSAMQLAQWLESQPNIEHVYYPGLASHPQHELACRQQPGGFGGIVSFTIAGGREAAFDLIDAARMLSITGNLGDTRSTIVHPATTTHAKLGPEAKSKAGISEGLLRLSVGLENTKDIKADLARGGLD